MFLEKNVGMSMHAYIISSKHDDEIIHYCKVSACTLSHSFHCEYSTSITSSLPFLSPKFTEALDQNTFWQYFFCFLLPSQNLLVVAVNVA